MTDLQVNSTHSGIGVGFVGSLQDRYSAPTLSSLTPMRTRIMTTSNHEFTRWVICY
ncbi:hypothetical protein [Moraxella ovis]|uniref:hypothetical protein n=1 Tax=Moraxella ovis TaxID=29433 RepID=UPI0015ECA6D2|nr:hypothetical protein [Moraxella ovis]